MRALTEGLLKLLNNYPRYQTQQILHIPAFPFKIKGGTAKVCRISYMSDKIYVYVKSLFIVPSSDLTTSYNFSGVYGKKYNGKEFHWHEEVVDKLYRSIKLN